MFFTKPTTETFISKKNLIWGGFITPFLKISKNLLIWGGLLEGGFITPYEVNQKRLVVMLSGGRLAFIDSKLRAKDKRRNWKKLVSFTPISEWWTIWVKMFPKVWGSNGEIGSWQTLIRFASTCFLSDWKSWSTKLKTPNLLRSAKRFYKKKLIILSLYPVVCTASCLVYIKSTVFDLRYWILIPHSVKEAICWEWNLQPACSSISFNKNVFVFKFCEKVTAFGKFVFLLWSWSKKSCFFFLVTRRFVRSTLHFFLQPNNIIFARKWVSTDLQRIRKKWEKLKGKQTKHTLFQFTLKWLLMDIFWW